MKYQDFVIIARYLNQINKEKFEDAQNLWIEYEKSIRQDEPTRAMKSLCNELYQDMDFMDYCDLPPFMNEIRTTSEMVHVLKSAVDFI